MCINAGTYLACVQLGDDHARAAPPALQHTLAQDLMQGAAQGLRTLMLATRVLGAKQWEAWNRLYQAAASSLDAREKKIAQVRYMTQRCLALAFVRKLPPCL